MCGDLCKSCTRVSHVVFLSEFWPVCSNVKICFSVGRPLNGVNRICSRFDSTVV
jgi:hypothetical protein